MIKLRPWEKPGKVWRVWRPDESATEDDALEVEAFDAAQAADFFFLAELPPYDAAELVPQKGDARMSEELKAELGRERSLIDQENRLLTAGLKGHRK